MMDRVQKPSYIKFPLFELFRIALYAYCCSNTKTVTGIWKILFVDGSDALNSGLHKFPINPGARIKNKIPQVENVLILIKDN
jgi:hypothetical protein